MEKKERIEERKERLKTWLKNPYNFALIILLVFAFSIRLYFFFMTDNQPVWWDEGEYMLKAKNLAFGTPETGWAANIRPVLFPLIAAVFFKLGLGEVSLRFIIILISVGSVFLVYIIGKDLFNEKIGLMASFIFSVFYIDLFYATRLLVDVPQVFFILLAGMLFIKYHFHNKSNKLVWAILPILFFGTMMRFTVGIFIIVLLAFLLVTENIKLFKEKDWYISAFLGILAFLPYMIYSWIKFKNPLFVIVSVISANPQTRNPGDTPLSVFMQYINYFPNYLHLFFFLSFLAGLILALFSLVLRFDRIISNKEPQKYFFLVLWILLPLVYFGFFINHFEDRYIFMVFPAVFILSGVALDKVYAFLNRYNKSLAIVVIFFLLLFGGYKMLSNTDSLIKNKLDTYKGLKDSGLWIKEQSSSGDIVLSGGVPEITYYSERATISPNTFASMEELLVMINKDKPRYMVLSIWERQPDWLINWSQQNSDKVKPVQAFFLDEAQQQVSAVVYEFQY
jgi:4-amino-4-deoxy-L-arabinose transferase-like glycosyltransferase